MRSLHLDAQLHQQTEEWKSSYTQYSVATWVSWAEHANVKRGEYCSGYVDNRASEGIWDLICSAVVQEGRMKELSSENENY